jgi:hypothetical protein
MKFLWNRLETSDNSQGIVLEKPFDYPQSKFLNQSLDKNAIFFQCPYKKYKTKIKPLKWPSKGTEY